MEKQKDKKISYMNVLETDIHALPEIKASKLDSRPLSVVSFFQLSAKSGSRRKDPFSVFSFCLTKQIFRKKQVVILFFVFGFFFYFEKQMNVWPTDDFEEFHLKSHLPHKTKPTEMQLLSFACSCNATNLSHQVHFQRSAHQMRFRTHGKQKNNTGQRLLPGGWKYVLVP